MAKHFLPDLSRRRFFGWSAAGITAAVSVPVAGGAEVIRIGPRERPASDIEAWNVGLISAGRPNCYSACNFDPLMGGIGVQN
jgi:hypothetical protein